MLVFLIWTAVHELPHLQILASVILSDVLRNLPEVYPLPHKTWFEGSIIQDSTSWRYSIKRRLLELA
jgi:hypothetical protein